MKIFKRLIYIYIIMFFFFNNGNAEYKKIFFDFNIKNINDEKIELSIYKKKTIFNNAKIISLNKSASKLLNTGINIKINITAIS